MDDNLGGFVFALTKQQGKISHLNIRTEYHGEENVLAIDVRVESDVTNDFLSYLAPTLKSALYAKPAARQMELIEDDTYLPSLRYSFLPDLRVAGQMKRAVFVLHGSKAERDLQFEANIDKLTLGCKEGGTVSIAFRAAVLPTTEQSGALAGLLGADLRISVREADEEADMFREGSELVLDGE